MNKKYIIKYKENNLYINTNYQCKVCNIISITQPIVNIIENLPPLRVFNHNEIKYKVLEIHGNGNNIKRLYSVKCGYDKCKYNQDFIIKAENYKDMIKKYYRIQNKIIQDQHSSTFYKK